MGHLAAMPTLKDHSQRRAYGNEILPNTARAFDPHDPETGLFFSLVQARVVEMQEAPSWFHSLSDTDEKVVNNYRTVRIILDAMKCLGFSGASAGAAKIGGGALGGGIKELEARSGVRAIASGALKGGQATGKKMLTGGLSTRAGIFTWIIGQAVFYSLSADSDTMNKEINRRYQERKLTSDQYKRAFGSAFSLPAQYFFKLQF